jgi:succinoglycan biosynthesis transport protein ExoP
LAVAPRIDKTDAPGNAELGRNRQSGLAASSLTTIFHLGRILKLALGLSIRDRNRPVDRANSMRAAPANGSLAIRDDIMRYVQDSPFSRYAEAMRSIKVAADIVFMDHKTKVIGFTSSLPNEGKTTISASFAQILAQGGSKVVLVDADLRNPSLTRFLTPSATQGLLEVVLENLDLDSTIVVDPATKLAFLPAVIPSRISQTSEILSSAAMAKVVDRLRERFDWIIVDLSPLAPVIDVRSTSRFIDAYVLVVEWGRTKTDAIRQALRDSPMLQDHIIGAVLNKANIDVLNRYDSYAGNYYNQYYHRYGYVD